MLKISEEPIFGAHGGLGRSTHDYEWSGSELLLYLSRREEEIKKSPGQNKLRVEGRNVRY